MHAVVAPAYLSNAWCAGVLCQHHEQQNRRHSCLTRCLTSKKAQVCATQQLRHLLRSLLRDAASMPSVPLQSPPDAIQNRPFGLER